jgi:D-alanyl-D-alanine carboxypeptidase
MLFEKVNIDKLLESCLSAEVPGLILALSNKNDNYLGSAGNLKPDSQFFIASTTKLYVTALIMQMIDSRLLHLDDKITKFLPAHLTHGLHAFHKIDYTDQITVQNLLSHTSGLPDYFQANRKSKKSLMNQVLSGEDQAWNLSQVIDDSKNIGAAFPPSSGKALYSDTNYQLLGSIIENIYGLHFSEVLTEKICKKIGLLNTYLYQNEFDLNPAPLNYKKTVLRIPKAMTSFGPDGGIVSNASDGIRFLKSFFEGHLFEGKNIPILTSKWRNIFYPMKYGIGISLFRLPWYFSPFKKVPDLIGHSGLSGAFYYFCPEKDLYLVGTVNQIANPQTSFKLMINALLKS